MTAFASANRRTAAAILICLSAPLLRVSGFSPLSHQGPKVSVGWRENRQCHLARCDVGFRPSASRLTRCNFGPNGNGDQGTSSSTSRDSRKEINVSVEPFESSFGSMEGSTKPTSENLKPPPASTSAQIVPHEKFIFDKLTETWIIVTPALMASLAFVLYKDTSQAFHDFAIHQHSWKAVDGGNYLTDLLTPALNGPVTTSISILFGTLVSMTVSKLYERQTILASALSDLIDEVRVVELHVDFFPEPYRSRADQLLDDFLRAIFKDAAAGELKPESLRSGREIGQMVSLVNELSIDPAHADARLGHIIDQAYGTLQKIISHRSLIISTHENRFPLWHYGNLAVLASTICLIFLILTDKAALLFLGGFQLRICWAMLVGTFSMLAVVLYDLNTPLSGVFQIVKTKNMNSYTLRDYEGVLRGDQKNKDSIKRTS